MSKETFLFLEDGTYVEKKLPKMTNSMEYMETMTEMADEMSSGVSNIIGTNFLVNLIFASSLSSLWGMIHSFEIVASFFLLKLNLPQNSIIMYKMLYDISNFSFLPEDFF